MVTSPLPLPEAQREFYSNWSPREPGGTPRGEPQESKRAQQLVNYPLSVPTKRQQQLLLLVTCDSVYLSLQFGGQQFAPGLQFFDESTELSIFSLFSSFCTARMEVMTSKLFTCWTWLYKYNFTALSSFAYK